MILGLSFGSLEVICTDPLDVGRKLHTLAQVDKKRKIRENRVRTKGREEGAEKGEERRMRREKRTESKDKGEDSQRY